VKVNSVIRDSNDMEHVLSVTRDASCLISGFRREVNKNGALPGYYAESSGFKVSLQLTKDNNINCLLLY
jgi:hypothetical protein